MYSTEWGPRAPSAWCRGLLLPLPPSGEEHLSSLWLRLWLLLPKRRTRPSVARPGGPRAGVSLREKGLELEASGSGRAL